MCTVPSLSLKPWGCSTTAPTSKCSVLTRAVGNTRHITQPSVKRVDPPTQRVFIKACKPAAPLLAAMEDGSGSAAAAAQPPPSKKLKASAGASPSGAAKESSGGYAGGPLQPGVVSEAVLASGPALHKEYQAAQPYLHCVMRDIFNPQLLRAVREEIINNVEATYKETDLFKVFQTGAQTGTAARPRERGVAGNGPVWGRVGSLGVVCMGGGRLPLHGWPARTCKTTPSRHTQSAACANAPKGGCGCCVCVGGGDLAACTAGLRLHGAPQHSACARRLRLRALSASQSASAGPGKPCPPPIPPCHTLLVVACRAVLPCTALYRR